MREFTDGSTAIVRGAIDAGCDFFAGYPITPASPILMSMLREMPKVGGVAVQAEDEIASMGFCMGAVMSGMRALTATSGPGLSLYSENIGMAIMGEVPLVIVDVQRLGPATGGATTVSQGDVLFARWGTAGGYPLIVLAPSSVAECYGLTRRAFDLSERFRTPVILLTDKELNTTAAAVEVEDYDEAPVRERPRAEQGKGFEPYSYEPCGEVKPMAHYGEDIVLRFTGSTHDECAYITKHSPTVASLNEHLRAKIDDHVDEIELVASDLQEDARTLLVSYGITAGAMREAVERIRRDGGKVSAATVQSLWPVPEGALRAALEASPIERVVVGELNQGQYLPEVKRLAPHLEVIGVQRVDGELISPEEFVEVVR